MRRAVAFVALLSLLVVVGPLASSPAGSTTRERLPGLRAPASVTRDANGIAHIIAGNDHDVFFLQGFVHAEDRLFQMDLSRRQASGTRAELLGPELLADDIQLRTVGIRRGGERSYEALSDEAQAALDAYAEGVNAWVASHPLPSEYAEVEVASFEPWTGVDSAAVGKLIAFGLSFDLDIFTTFDYQAHVAAGEANGFDGNALWFEDVRRSAPFDPASTVPDATGAAPAMGATAAPAAEVDPAAAEAARAWYEEIKDIDFFREVLEEDRAAGSNEWGVAASETASGRPMIANDPHLSLDLPTTFYPIGLRTPDMNVVGEGFAGVPTVILGHNRHIAWGATTNSLDVTDAYVEEVVEDPASPSGLSTTYQGQLEPVEAIPEVFRVNDPANGASDDLAVIPPGTPVEGSDLGPVPESTLIVPRRNNGPLLLQAFSLQYTGFSGTRELETFLRWNKATNLEEFEEGLSFFDVGSQNWAYTDTTGNLAYFTSAEAPLREDLEAGAVVGNPPFFLRDGTGGNEWLPVSNPQPNQAVPYEILPVEEMPRVVNPPAGFFANANNDPAGNTLDNDVLNGVRPTGGIYYLAGGYDGGFRAGRITQRIREHIAGAETMSFAEMQDIQADVAMLDAEYFVPWLVSAYDAATTSAVPELAALAADPRVAEAVARLRGWDFRAVTGLAEGYDAADVDGALASPSDDEVADSVAATIYSVWRSQVVQDVVDATLEPYALPTPGSDQALSAIRHLLETYGSTAGVGASGLDFFAVPGVDDPAARRDLKLLRNLPAALDLLAGDDFAPAFAGSTDQDDYRWGRLHRITFDHPLGGDRNAPPAGDFASPPGLDGIATDGGFEVVDASGHSARSDAWDEFGFGGGPVRRFVGEALQSGIRPRSSQPGGPSGDVASPFYVNLLGEWLTNDTYVPELRYRAIQEGAVAITYYTP